VAMAPAAKVVMGARAAPAIQVDPTIMVAQVVREGPITTVDRADRDTARAGRVDRVDRVDPTIMVALEVRVITTAPADMTGMAPVGSPLRRLRCPAVGMIGRPRRRVHRTGAGAPDRATSRSGRMPARRRRGGRPVPRCTGPRTATPGASGGAGHWASGSPPNRG